MSKALNRYKHGGVVITQGCWVEILGSEVVEELDASDLDERDLMEVVARPEQFELKKVRGKLTRIVQRQQKKPSKDDPADPRMEERTP